MATDMRRVASPGIVKVGDKALASDQFIEAGQGLADVRIKLAIGFALLGQLIVMPVKIIRIQKF
jgi:hypothetical protein